MERKLDELIKIAEEDMKLDKSSLDSESLKTPRLHNKWLKLLYSRKDILFALELKRKNVYKRLWLYYNGKSSPDVYDKKGSFDLKVLKTDLGIFIDSDDELSAIDVQIHVVKQEIEFCVKTIDELNRRSFHISNALRFLNFTNGIN
jgi:hypothetical protein